MGYRLRRALLNLALFAMVLHALMPAGWMPGPASDGAISFVICSASGLHHIDGSDRRQDTGATHQHDACPFAAAIHLAPPVAGAQLATPSSAYISIGRRTASSAPIDRIAYLPQSPRAPPLSA